MATDEKEIDFEETPEGDEKFYAHWRKKIADANRDMHKRKKAAKLKDQNGKNTRKLDIPTIKSNPNYIAWNVNALILSLADTLAEAKQLDAMGQWRVSDRVSQKLRVARMDLDIIVRDVTIKRKELKTRITSNKGKGKGQGAKALGELDDKIVDNNDFSINQ